MNVEELVKKFDIKLVTDGPNKGRLMVSRPPKDPSAVEDLRKRKEEITEFIKAREKEEKERREERKQLIGQIEGLSEIQKAMNELESWHEAFNESFHDVGGVGVGKKPEYDFDAAYERYPRAAAYLKAKAEADKNNDEISAIGKKAQEEVIFGDYEKAMRDMEEELREFAERHAWD